MMEEITENERKIPKSVYFILLSKFCERFCATGISAILVIYLHTKMNLDQSTSTAIFHMNETFTFLFPLFGAIIGESYFGLFKTITIMCFVAFIGSLIIAATSIFNANIIVLSLTLISLSIVFASLGSIRSNLVAFGADQYHLPEESSNLKIYFSLQMLVIKIGSLIGRVVTPIFREDIKCFNTENCYLLAFAIPSIFILLAFFIMICGRLTFVCVKPFGNMFVKIIHSMFHALSEKFKRKQVKEHWMDYAVDKFGCDHINATKIVIGTMVIFLPTAIYWAVFMQQGSRWIFQAMRMNGEFGWINFKPDQMIALNSIFSILLLPVCNYWFFPLIKKIGIKSILHRISIGGFLCCISFILAAIVEIYIEKQVISMLWLMPQFAILALSENFVYISLMDFAYSETPDGMKSVMTAFVFLIIALGNLIITIISGFKFFQTQVNEFLFFAGILFIDMIIFIILSINYERNKRKIAIK